MHNTILENTKLLNQLNFDIFIDYFRSKSLFPDEIVERVFERNSSSELLEEKFNKTDLFLNEVVYDEIREILAKAQMLGNYNIDKLITALKKEAYLEISEINILVLIVEILKDHRPFFKEMLGFNQEDSTLFKFYNTILKKEFRSFVEPDGSENLENHPRLRKLYFKSLELDSSIRKKLNTYKVDPEVRNKLQHTSLDIINDRFVLAFRSDHYSSRIGQIISRSETGRTLYVEPALIKEDNFERIEIIIELKEMVHKIIKKIIEEFSYYTDELKFFANMLKKFDEYHLRASFCEKLNLTRPVISENFEIHLKGVFHPLIEKPVKNDFSIGESDYSLILSGPNTGGKTAFIKSVCLCQIFFNAALYLPARESKLSLTHSIYYYGNDEQNLEEGLSSFSSEVKNYSELIANLEGKNLIIIDEIFNSTSSEEASALAISLFDYIKKNSRSKILVSTHHQTLKSLLHARHDYISAHVGFESKTLSPTYKLHFGAPGASCALEVFKNFSNSIAKNEIYNNAIHLLDNKTLHYEKLLSSLSRKENELDKLISENRKLKADLKNQKEASKAVLNLKIEKELRSTKDEIQNILNKAHSILSSAKSGDIKNARELSKKQKDVQSLLRDITPKSESPKKSESAKKVQIKRPSKLIIGEKYYCTFINQTVTLLEIGLKEAKVAKGAMRLKVPTSTLGLTHKPKEDKVHVSINTHSESKLEYDCRGMRLDEFKTLIEQNVYKIQMKEIPFLNIIHGHGDGILKKWIRKYLRNHKSLKQDITDSGNDGETRVVLKS